MPVKNTEGKQKDKNNFYKLKLITVKSKEEFIKEYEKYDEIGARDIYIQALKELEKSVKLGNIDSLKYLTSVIDNFSCIENQISVKKNFHDFRNPFKSTNLVILACKHNQFEFLKHVFKYNKIFKILSNQAGKNILPKDEDETYHNAFYYAIRSGNVQLLNLLMNWSDSFFDDHKFELDEILSKACEELKLKNVLLTDEMEILVEDILIKLRFFTDTSRLDENITSDLGNIIKRVELVLESINLLKNENSDTEVDETYIYILKFITQNIYILKRLLKSTYDKLPWEELEFCLFAFISSHTKHQEMNLFYQVILDKGKLLHYLQVFASRLEEMKSSITGGNIKKLALLPNLNRETVIAGIIDRNPEFVELYNNYQQIRDIHSLEEINNNINLAITVDPKEKEGQIVIIRVLHLMGEYLKNTLESPKLSIATSELLLLSLSSDTRKIITSLRNSISHASSLYKRMKILESSDIEFFTGVQTDIKKIGSAIIDILYQKKLRVIRNLFKKIVDCKNFHEIKEVIKVLKNWSSEKLNLDSLKMTEHDKLEKLIKELYDNIEDKTVGEAELFAKIYHIISLAKNKFISIQDHHFIGLLSLQSLKNFMNCDKINDSILKRLKFYVNETLKNTTSPLDPCSLKEIAELSSKIFHSVQSRKFHENLECLYIILLEICYITEFPEGDIKWIEKFKSKLSEHSFTSVLEQSEINKVNIQLALKLSELKSFLKKNLLNCDNTEKVCSYKSDKKSQAFIEMIFLDIMSILSISNNYLENNLFFLDDDYPLFTGKCLRNHLAHDNTILDIFLTNPCLAVALNAKKIIQEDVITNKKKIGHLTADNPVRLREKHYHSLKIIALQKKMYAALEEGNLEIVKDCLKKGADIHGRSINSWTALHFAAKGSNLEMIKFILSQNVSINVKDQTGQNPLHVAATYGNACIVEYFIKKTNLFVGDVDDDFKTPLHIAAQRGYKDVVELLLKYDAAIASRNLDFSSPLHFAITNNHFDTAKILLEKCVNVDIHIFIGGLSSLHVAAVVGNLEIVNFLLENGANVNAKTDKNWTPLHYAAFHGHLDIVNALILKSADINAIILSGHTPLHCALLNGHEEIANVLLSYGAEVNISSKIGNSTPLHHAAMNGYETIVKTLLKYGADSNAKTIEGETPLHMAAQSGCLEIITALLKHGANINAKDKINVSPLHCAVANNQKDSAAFLIKNGAEIDAKADANTTPLHIAVLNGLKDIIVFLLDNDACINSKDVKGNTIMHAAAMNGCKDVIAILIEYNVEINIRNNGGFTPLHLTSRNDCEDTIVFLIKNGAEVNDRSDTGRTPLHEAVESGHKNIVELLIKNKADINAEYIRGHTSLHLAIKAGHKEIVEVLIANGAAVNVVSRDNYTDPLSIAVRYDYKQIVNVLIENGAIVNDKADGPLFLAVAAGYKDIVEILIKKKAKINIVGSENATLLHIAAKRGKREIVKTLIKMGADVNAKTSHKMTPLFFAAQEGHEEVVELLIINGAILTIVSDEGLTPLHIAAANGHCNVIKVLLYYGMNVNIRDYKIRTSFELAVSHGQLPVMKLLKSKKINLNIRDYNVALHIATLGNNLTIVKYLVDMGADVNCKNNSGLKPIQIAARDGFREAVEYFLSMGCCINDCDAFNRTALHDAVSEGRVDIVKYLIDQGANVNIKDLIGFSPLHIAVILGFKDTTEVLLENGAAYNAVDNFGRKALDVAHRKDVFEYLMSTKKYFEAVKSNNVSEVKKFIKKGVIVDVKNTDGMTPLHFAAWKGHNEVLNILLENNANPNTVGSKGITPLHYAVEFSHLKVIKALLSYGAIFNAVSKNGKKPVDFSKEESITKLFKTVADSFKSVKSGNDKVINNLNRIKDIDTIKAIMNACNSEHKSLIVVAIHCNFKKTEQLKNISLDDVSDMKIMAQMFRDRGDYKRALCILNDLYEKRRSILRPNNPGILEIEQYIATCLYEQGRYNEALIKLEEIYQKQSEILGLRCRDTFNTRLTIGKVLSSLGKNKEALEIYQEAYQNHKEIIGLNHEDILGIEHDMALELNALGKYEEALNLNKKVYKENKQIFGADDPSTVRAQNNIAVTLASQGDYEQSLEIYKEVLEKKKLVFGLYHTDTLRTLQSIASIYVNQMKYLEALKAYEEVFNIQKIVLGTDNPETLRTQYFMADVLFRQGKLANALKIYSECFDPIKVVFGQSNKLALDISEKLEFIKFRFKLEGIEAAEILLHMQENMKTAVKNGDIPTIIRLLKTGIDINEKDNSGITALHYAVSLGKIDIVNILLQNGADVFQVTNKCNTSLHLAASKSNRGIVEVLLQHVPHKKQSSFVNAGTISGTTALHVAARNSSLDIITILLKYGAIYEVENNDGKKPLNLSTNQRVESLLKLIGDLFDGTKDGNTEIVKRLKSLNKDEFLAAMNARNNQGNTMLQVAIANKHLEIADKFLKMLKVFKN